MRIDTPETPAFWDQLEAELATRASRRHRFRFASRLTALRALRTFTRHAVHSLAVVSLSAVMVMSWTEPTGETAHVEINAMPTTPGYLTQYGVEPDWDSTVLRATENGYEVAVQRLFTTNPSEDGQILVQRHPGPIAAFEARGPMLFVVGYTVGPDGVPAN